jgi:hypothetical protein
LLNVVRGDAPLKWNNCKPCAPPTASSFPEVDMLIAPILVTAGVGIFSQVFVEVMLPALLMV